ncbi:MAG: RlmE family RNA methyltransferase [Parvibaculum sp.]|uniref:RlmE family RNA methyltransferase n=1 Tax=Parvibaculum sp. TaxID=2024848 RepID=UPI00284D8B99|nr:RlmE family RNA methyltransferase [Parvibaculum sp.]MDR3500902.1 RlmE family RNA methyltransferase [Parvibaculum sp.]
MTGKKPGTTATGPEAGARKLRVRVKTAKNRTLSSARWLERQLNDPYVQAAKKEGFRSRAAYKLAEIDDKYHFLKPGGRIVDLGAAPGGWCQIAVARTHALEGRSAKRGRVIGVDIGNMDELPGATVMKLDFLAEGADAEVKKVLGGEADVVLSDMAAHATGHRQTDHLKIMALCEAAAYFAIDVLSEGGTYCAKVLRGGTENELLVLLKQHFQTVRHVKPKASRADSAEMYVLAQGFRRHSADS